MCFNCSFFCSNNSFKVQKSACLLGFVILTVGGTLNSDRKLIGRFNKIFKFLVNIATHHVHPNKCAVNRKWEI